MDLGGQDNSTCYIGYDNEDGTIANYETNVHSLGPWEIELPPGPLQEDQLFVRCYFTFGVRVLFF